MVDSREHAHAITDILKTFDEAGIEHVSCKLLFGDYQDFNRPGVVIDRKRNIAELAKNCTVEAQRFKNELERAQRANSRLVILVEQNRYKDRDKWVSVNEISDLIMWSNPHTTIRGEKVFRVLSSWVAKYDLGIEFCDKRVTGKRIIEILYPELRK